MINFAIRYRPILDTLQRLQPEVVLEVGSGPEGLALFWPGQVVGADLSFKRPPLHRALGASALALPFPDRSWPLVVSCDTLEHIPPALRLTAVKELTRVTQQRLLLAFPSGAAAADCYGDLGRHLKEPLPAWLSEHLTHGLPDATETAHWLRKEGWSVKIRWYESAAAHKRLMLWETRRPVQMLTYSLMRLIGPWLAPRWPVATEGDLLRVLLIAERL